MDSFLLENVILTPELPVAERIIYVDAVVKRPEGVREAMIEYRIGDRIHPSPMVLHQGRLRGMIHPLRPGTVCEWRVELTGWDGLKVKWPASGTVRFSAGQ